MPATELLAKVNRFLAEQTQVDAGHKQQSLTLSWQSKPSEPIAESVAEITAALSPPAEALERAEPGPIAQAAAHLTGRPLNVHAGTQFKRQVWTLSDEQLSFVAGWLDRNEDSLAKHSAVAMANRHVAFRWLPHHRGDQAEFTHPQLFGVVLTRPRHIQVPFQFYDAAHYWRIKQYMGDIELASLIDKSVLPKGSLTGGITGRK